MGGQNTNKLNRLLKDWLQGTVMTQAYLNRLGIYRQLVNKYLRHNWLDRLGATAYIRSGDSVEWPGGLYALQSHLEMSVHVGGQTALELQGRAHFIPLGDKKRVILISDRSERLPAWFREHQWGVVLEHRCLYLFDKAPEDSVIGLDCGGFSVEISGAERAVMEEMSLARTNDDISHIYQLMEGLGTLRPRMVQMLLEECRSVKVKRLFLWNAETVNHSWFKRLDLSRVDLGKGKRHLYRGGVLNQKYQITVPKIEEGADV